MASRIIQRGVEKNFTAVLLQDRIGSDIVGPLTFRISVHRWHNYSACAEYYRVIITILVGSLH